MGIFKVVPGEHVVRDTEFSGFLRRHLRDPDLFTAFNTIEGRWFLARWIRKDQGLAQDIEDLGANLERADRKLVADLERSRDGVSSEDLKKRYIRREQAGMEFEVEQAQEFQEAQDWVQKKTGSTVPVLVG